MISPPRHNPVTRRHHLSSREARKKEQAMTRLKTLMIAAPIALGLLSAPAARAEWRHGGWGYHGYAHRGYGVPLAAALLGLGVGAAIVASQPAYAPPPAYYYPPPGYYPAPAYAQPNYPAPYYPGAGAGH
jgi:hypothetical protein